MTQNQIAYWRLQHDKGYDYHKTGVDKDLKQQQINEEKRKNLVNEALKNAQLKIDEAFKKGQINIANKNFIRDTVLGSIGTVLNTVGTATTGIKNIGSAIASVSKLM